mgnify:FL=1
MISLKRKTRKNPIKRIIKKIEEKVVNGKPKTTYFYDYAYDDSNKKVSKEDEEYASKLFIPHRIDNESLKIYPKGSKVLAEYKDIKGRKIHRYSQKEILQNVLEKYKRNKLFIKASPNIVKELKASINPNTDKGQAALILYIIYKTGLRIGSDTDTKADQKAYGVSTLLSKHVKFLAGNKVKLEFIGKKGVENSAIINDSIIYDALKKLKGKAYSTKLFKVNGNYVRNYLNSIDDRFNIKDFRTLKAYEIANKEIEKRKGPASDEKTFLKWQREVGDKVAKELGNTRTVAINDYINPGLWDKWRGDKLGPWMPKKLMRRDL